MKSFVRHLRTRPAVRPPKTNLTKASISATTPEPLVTHLPPSPTISKPDSPEPLTSPNSSVRTALWDKHPLHPHPSHTQPQFYNPPTQSHPSTLKEDPISRSKLHVSDIAPPGITNTAYRWETLAPSTQQLQNADTFFLKYPPKHLWSEAKFKKIDFGNVPEVVFLGRSNVGKSSLLNALLNNKKLAYTSSKPGRTRLMNAFSIANGRLVLLDMPGYGHASREDWGVQIMKYLKSRKQFRRAFLLIDAKHRLKKNDLQLLEQFGQEGISFQIVLSKVDRVKPDEVTNLFEEVRDLMENGTLGMNAGLGEILATAGDPAKKGQKKVGLSDLRWAVMVASGLEGVYV